MPMAAVRATRARNSSTAKRAMWINSSAYYGGFVADIQDFEFTQAPMPYDPARPLRAAEFHHRRRDALGPARP